MELYNKTTLSDKIIAECLVTLLWKNRKEISKFIIKDRVNKNNIDTILERFIAYAGEDNLNSESGKEIYNMLINRKNYYSYFKTTEKKGKIGENAKEIFEIGEKT